MIDVNHTENTKAVTSERVQMPKSHAAITEGGGVLARYQDVIVGSRSLWRMFYLECCSWLAIVPGALGIFLRKVFWPRLFGSCGHGVVFGANIIVRHPHRIHLGNRVVISENCTLDARNPGLAKTIVLGDDGILSNDVRIACKNGSVTIGPRFGIGAQTIIASGDHEPISIGADVLIGPRCYITGGGNYNIDRIDIPIREQGRRQMGGSIIEDDVWVGANVSILGGVRLSTGTVAATGSVITKSTPPRSVCAGVPARTLRIRGGE